MSKKTSAIVLSSLIVMNQVSEKVYQEFGVTLEPEVKRLGEF